MMEKKSTVDVQDEVHSERNKSDLFAFLCVVFTSFSFIGGRIGCLYCLAYYIEVWKIHLKCCFDVVWAGKYR